MSSISLTPGNRGLVKKLLRVGRWNNESEIVRYGLQLVEREVEALRRRALKPLSSTEKRLVAEADDRVEIQELGAKSAVPPNSYFDK